MKKLTHNGILVRVQTIHDDNFASVLAENGIEPAELPILDYLVYMYDVNGETRYAACVPFPDGETVYMINSIPADGWKNLIFDIDNQICGAEPARMETRLHMATVAATKTAEKYLFEKYPNDGINLTFGLRTDAQKYDFNVMFRAEMAKYGYCADNVKNMHAWDVDIDGLLNGLK